MKKASLVALLLFAVVFAGACLPARTFAEDWLQVVTDGQSLSIGIGGSPALSTTTPPGYNDWMWDTNANHARSTLIPLVEPTPGCGCGDESPVSSLGYTATMLSPSSSQAFIVDHHGVSGVNYAFLSKTGPSYFMFATSSYNDLLDSVTKAHALAVGAGKTYRVAAIVVSHGQTDYSNGVDAATFEGDLEQWQSDLNTDIKAITGQSQDVPMIVSQMADWTSYGSNFSTPTVGGAGYGFTPSTPIGEWWAARDNFGEIYMSGPEYVYQSYSDGVHLTNVGYRARGGLEGKIVDQIALQGKPWKPLAPRSITISGNTITARFWVPTGTLAFDTTMVSSTTDGNLGFEYHQSGSSSAAISNVQITASDTVTITLSSAPSGTPYLAYAYTGVGGAAAGPTTGPRGNLRDTDPTLDYAGDHLYDWGITFNESIPFATPASWGPAAPIASAQVTGNVKLTGGAMIY